MKSNLKYLLVLLFLELLSPDSQAQKLVFDSTYHSDFQFKFSSVYGCHLINDSSFVIYGSIDEPFVPNSPRFMQKYDLNSFQLDEFFHLPQEVNLDIFNCEINNDSIYIESLQIHKVSLNTQDLNWNFYQNTMDTSNCLNSHIFYGANQIYIKETNKFLGGDIFLIPGSDTVRPGGFYLYSINPDGTFDRNFLHNTNGGINSFGKGFDSTYYICGSFTEYDGIPANKIIKIDADGNLLDNQAPFAVNSYTPIVMSTDPDGKIIVIGTLILNDQPNDTVSIVRLNSDLTLDTTFHYNNFPYYYGASGMYGFQRLDDGYIIVGDFNNFFGFERQCLARITLNGDIDTVEFKNSGLDHNPVMGMTPYAFSVTRIKDYIYVTGQFDGYDGHLVPPVIRFKMVYDDTTVVEPTPIYTDFSVYPNPSNGIFTVEFNQQDNNSYPLEIFDMAGKIIVTNSYDSNKHIVDISSFSSGIYFFKHEENIIRVLKN